MTVDYDSLTWQRAIGATPDVALVTLDEGGGGDGIPLVRWTMFMRDLLDYRDGCTIECRADPTLWGRSGSVIVQVRRPHDPAFVGPQRLNHYRKWPKSAPPTSVIQVEAPPAKAWSALLREARFLAIGG